MAGSEQTGVGAVAVLAIVDFAKGSRLRGMGNLMFGRWPLARTPGLKFGKVMGSGHEGGFVVKPSASHQGTFAVFDDDAAADAFLNDSKQVALYRELGESWLTLKLRAFTSRGAWSGVVPLALSAPRPTTGAVASLTRGSIRPTKAKAFWSHSPAAQAALEGNADCLLAVGLGEAPLFRQCTFSIWKSEAALEGYARGGAHRTAAHAALEHGHFSESLFARLVPYSAAGRWKGRDAAELGLATAPP